jgi:anti-sigma B factor antagonist
MSVDYAIRADGVAVLQLVGKLNMVSAGPLRKQIADLVEQGHSRVAIDLGEMEFLDSSGLGALISGLKSTRQAGGDLRIAAPNEQARLVLSLTGMERVLPPYPDVESTFE